MFIKRLRLQV